jgi:hypothetical protein
MGRCCENTMLQPMTAKDTVLAAKHRIESELRQMYGNKTANLSYSTEFG